MTRSFRTMAVAAAAVVTLGAGAASGQGVPVIDAGSIAQAIAQLNQMQQDYANQIEQLTNLRDQLTSMTGDKGISGYPELRV